MTTRITDKDLQTIIDRINRITDSPAAPYGRLEIAGEYRFIAQIGNYHLDHCNGGVSLVRMYNDAGGVSTVIHRCTKRELYYRMHAFIDGLSTAQAAVAS